MKYVFVLLYTICVGSYRTKIDNVVYSGYQSKLKCLNEKSQTKIATLTI